MRSRFTTYGILVIILTVSLSTCSPSVRSLCPEEIGDSKADEVVFFTSEHGIIRTDPDSCVLMGADSQCVLHIQGIQEADENREQFRHFEGNLAPSAVDSIQGVYRPSIYHAGPLFLLLSTAVVVGVLLSWRIIFYE